MIDGRQPPTRTKQSLAEKSTTDDHHKRVLQTFVSSELEAGSQLKYGDLIPEARARPQVDRPESSTTTWLTYRCPISVLRICRVVLQNPYEGLLCLDHPALDFERNFRFGDPQGWHRYPFSSRLSACAIILPSLGITVPAPELTRYESCATTVTQKDSRSLHARGCTRTTPSGPKKSLIRRLDGNGTMPRGILQNPSGNGKWRHHRDLDPCECFPARLKFLETAPLNRIRFIQHSPPALV